MFIARQNYFSKMKVRKNERRKATKKCKECGHFLGKSCFRFSVSDDAIFCREDCAIKIKIKVKASMNDNDESEFYI